MNYTCRMMKPEDRLRLAGLSKAKSERTGVEHWLPPLDEAETELTFVFEKDGELLGALVVRRIHELILVGTNPELALAVEEAHLRLQAIGKRHGISEMVGWVPKALLRAGRKVGLEKCFERMGFTRIDERFACFEGRTLGD